MDTDSAGTAADAQQRRSIGRDALGVGLATGAYGLSFGVISVASGLSVWQTSVLSLLMFTGASQFAYVGVLGIGGGPASAMASATLLGARNSFYGIQLTRLVGALGWRRFVAAHLVIDESAAMAGARPTMAQARFAFWSTGLSVFVLWNLATVLGAVGAGFIADPNVFGLDMAAPAAFVALLAPRMKNTQAWALALGGAAIALAVAGVVPAGVPVLAAAGYAVLVWLVRK